MASALVQFRTDEEVKTEAIQICERLGMNLPSYLKMCMLRLVQERGVPFSMRLEPETENPGITRAGQIAAERGISDMTLDEINAEIEEARK